MAGVGTTGEPTGITTASSTTTHRTIRAVRLSGAIVDPAALVIRAASLAVLVLPGCIRVDLRGAEASILGRLPAVEYPGRAPAPSAASTMEGQPKDSLRAVERAPAAFMAAVSAAPTAVEVTGKNRVRRMRRTGTPRGAPRIDGEQASPAQQEKHHDENV